MMVVANFHKNPEMSKALSAKFRLKPFFKHKVLNGASGKNFQAKLLRFKPLIVLELRHVPPSFNIHKIFTRNTHHAHEYCD